MKAKGSLTKQEAEIEITKEEVHSFFSDIIPDFVQETGGILSDTVRFWRWKNQINIVKKAKAIIEANSLDKQKTSLKVLVPLLNTSSLEEDEILQNKWANLLANAITGSAFVKPNFIEILNELSALEVQLLDKIYDEAMKEPDYKKRKQLQYGKEQVCKIYSLPSDQFDLMVENLFRLGICQPPGSTGIMFGDARVALRTTDVFELTTLGMEFIKACREPIKNNNPA